VFESIVIPLTFYVAAKFYPPHISLFYKAKNKRFQICTYKKTFNHAVQKLFAMVDWKLDIRNKLYEV